MPVEQGAHYALDAWQVKVYHRGLKQFTGVERGQFRVEVAQRNHIGLVIRAFIRMEAYRLSIGISWFEAKTGITRDAVCAFGGNPPHPSITRCSTSNPNSIRQQHLVVVIGHLGQ